ncbi:MAG: DUF58 domain-containing protein [Candidatus Woesearchaeota archaeon]|jgi:uncharacterized protein (DUF58 family)|nr:DUF58 domain-containing protein [Candidatus Woesearchaeota archaeon]MDP7506244.1 DUF58 domain-containing protein [Candidatus Woesearchaeota archaeon]MDP7610685.1 DUF58 domain-containing protein [Candidatus Woesearchaeota archaeon]|tara:strand:- start:1089 stop:1994 length:906 start_codon:yes stop_codon:yes gene_type:complete
MADKTDNRKLKLEFAPSIKKLEVVTKTLIQSKFIGEYKSVFKGKGLEFMGYRPFTQDDDAYQIDWKASLRSNQMMVKQFAEERELEVFFLVDVSSSMLLSSTEKLKAEYVAEVIASMAYAILSSGDSVGLSMFSDKIVKRVDFKKGIGQFYLLSNALVDLNYYGGTFDLAEALKHLFVFLKERSLLIIVSDFIPLREDWASYLPIVINKFEVIGIMIKDPLDSYMPKVNGRVALADPFSKKKMLIEPNHIRELYNKQAEKDDAWVEKVFYESNADFMKLRTDKEFIKPFIELFRKRTMRFK